MISRAKKWLYAHSSRHRQMAILGYMGMLEHRLVEMQNKLDKIEKKLNEK